MIEATVHPPQPRLRERFTAKLNWIDAAMDKIKSDSPKNVAFRLLKSVALTDQRYSEIFLQFEIAAVNDGLSDSTRKAYLMWLNIWINKGGNPLDFVTSIKSDSSRSQANSAFKFLYERALGEGWPLTIAGKPNVISPLD